MGEGKVAVDGKRSTRKFPLRLRSSKRHSMGGESTTQASTTADKQISNKEMAASFLQYCAMCEKQITTPSNSILYCSEACRRKDSAKPLSASSITSPSPSPAHARPTLPAPLQSPSSVDNGTPAIRIPADLHDHESIMDPTEWKPKLPHRATSEAYRYLAQFHQTINAADPGASGRPMAARPKSMVTMHSTTPSLGNSPTTVASSFDSLYYEFNLRPLPPRQNPLYSTSAGGPHSKGIDLVTPHVPPSGPDVMGTSAPSVSYDNDFWGKKKVLPAPGTTPSAADGIGALFGKET